MRCPALALFTAVPLLSLSTSHGAITFNLVFDAQAESSLSESEKAIFTDALQFWDDIIDGHRDGVDRTWTLTVSTFSQAASGGGVVLGSASVSALSFSGFVPEAQTSDGRFIISTAGSANFNIHPDAGALDPLVIQHEIGHALGIGTLWEDNQLYNNGIDGDSNRTLIGGTPGELVGEATLAAYQEEFDSGATFVPVQLDGGTGTAHAHWNEVADTFTMENEPGPDGDPGDGGPAPEDGDGNSLDDALMSGDITGGGWITKTTIANLTDLGFTLHAAYIPEPSSLMLLGLGLLGVTRRRR